MPVDKALGAVLLQGNVSSEELKQASQTEGKYLKFRNRLKPIAFASKSLSEAEQRYSNIERELLGVVWAIQHFNHYTFANKINIISDHKPLQPLFSGKSLTSCSPRTARLLLKVIDRDVRFFYQQGPSMYLSDPLSRLSSHNTQDGNKEEVQGLKVNICDITSVKNVTLDQFKEHTASDEDFQLLKMYVMHGWPSAQQDCVEQLRSYFTFKEEIAFIDGLLFKGNRLIVPKALRNKTLQVLHRSHMGIVKTQERARTSFYWPGLNIARQPYPGKVQVHFETPKVPMTSPTIMSKQASSSSHRPFHYNNTFNANATSTPSSITSSTKSSMSLPKIQTQTLSSHHDTKSCSLKNRDPIHNRDVPQHQPGIQLRNQSAKSAKTQGKLAITADKLKSSMPQQTRSGRRVTKPKRYED